MRRMKCPNSNRPSRGNDPANVPPATDATAVHAALGQLARIVAGPGFARPESLTWDDITDYALALIRLREAACAAGCERLTQACDALAVTVSRLIDDRHCACQDKLLSLKHFVSHARAMLPAPACPSAHPNTTRPHAAHRAPPAPRPARSRMVLA